LNIINKQPVSHLGYKFIADKYIPKGSDEYYLRYQQTKANSFYRKLSALEIEILVRNRNTSDDWNNILVTDEFNGELVKNCKFYGLIRIGALQPYCLEFHDYKMPVGIYNSTIISCDIGDNVSIDQVNYLSHYIIGNEVMISNVGEIATTNHAKFGAGITKEDEKESVRTWIELCNENGGRSVLPFDGMLAGDAFLWSKYRNRKQLLERFFDFTQKEYNSLRGYYGSIGDRTIIKNCGIIKDVKVGSDAYFKGATKLKNLTVNSDAQRTSQIGEGCELVNGIIGYGCRIFYGVKAVRFIMASHAQLKYGARLINSYLGNNSTISCCEVLNTLIFPSHEQHHNNSFLCAAMVQGQSNIAAGATIGSNHNSRSADGEIVAGRGFWPGLCVSLKHNSKFAAFTILAKSDFPAELNITLPFSLVSNDVTNNKLTIMPAYWFMYNMYALARNANKYAERDKRQEKIQTLEFDYLAPDTAAEMLQAVQYLQTLPLNEQGSATVTGFENTQRPTELIKVPQSIAAYKQFLVFYFAKNIFEFIQTTQIFDFTTLKKHLVSQVSPTKWVNVGGQFILEADLQKFLKRVEEGKVKGWNEVHNFYRTTGEAYTANKLVNAYNTYLQVANITGKQFTVDTLKEVLKEFLNTQTYICNNILNARQKDYTNPFRKMVYQDDTEMNEVLGKLEDNTFIQQEFKKLDDNKKAIKTILKKLA
jgi:hypothetical protein